jgi:hypothetical protein
MSFYEVTKLFFLVVLLTMEGTTVAQAPTSQPSTQPSMKVI